MLFILTYISKCYLFLHIYLNVIYSYIYILMLFILTYISKCYLYLHIYLNVIYTYIYI